MIALGVIVLLVTLWVLIVGIGVVMCGPSRRMFAEGTVMWAGLVVVIGGAVTGVLLIGGGLL